MFLAFYHSSWFMGVDVLPPHLRMILVMREQLASV